MPKSSKPRKKYRPKKVFINPAAYAVESATQLTDHGSYSIDWKLRAHISMSALEKGEATRDEIEDLIAAHNITEALVRTRKLDGAQAVTDRSHRAFQSMMDRCAGRECLALNYEERAAINDMLDLHDQLMDAITVHQLEEAIAYAKGQLRSGNFTALIKTKEVIA